MVLLLTEIVQRLLISRGTASCAHSQESYRTNTKMSSESVITEQQITSKQSKLETRKRFEAVFPILVEELTSYLSSINLPQSAIEWFKKVS